ncbi:catalase [Alkalibacterium sp. 20]|uniref:catalase n=1 Tax=Alkalibacterium sp. 20 TaxID=1798803 RepID=UPI0008FFFCD0|nr:catalase [Alkalibacterium sp. 20]OJF90315.1 catalase [Alkalibacterium sp. 20]
MIEHNSKLTTSTGAPVGDNQNSITAGQHGPTLLQDVHLIEKLAHFNRERVPERVVHAKGAGAHGHFTVTNPDIANYTKADFLSAEGKETPMFIRLSTVAGELGSADTVRDPRGFSVKFYTDEGNYDLVGNNTPVFFIRDAIKFPDFIHTQKRNPQTNLKDANMVWDFWSLSPESLHQITILHSDRGIPATLRHMQGYGSHTFKWVNKDGDSCWVKYHFRTDQGVKNMDPEVAGKIAGEHPDYHAEDLFNAIEEGDFPSWTLKVQIMPEEDALQYAYDPFDITKVWSHKDYPLIEVGKMVLNRNSENYFAEVEQSAFSPGNFVPGVEASPDKMLQGRLFAYSDAHRYRIGANYNQLPINSPKVEVKNHQRGGTMSYSNGGSAVNYEPNSYDDLKESKEDKTKPFKVSGEADSVSYDNDDHFSQPRQLIEEVMSVDERQRLYKNFADHLSGVRDERIVERQLRLFHQVTPELAEVVAKHLEVKNPATAK